VDTRKKVLQTAVEAVLPEIIELRHKLHTIPEISFREVKTAELIRNFLSKTSVELSPPLLKTDTIALLKGGSEGKCIAFRSDIDALPITDKSGLPWFSKHRGFHHACGHDGHMAIVCGTVLVLDSLADMLSGSVRFIFQPAEEEGLGGEKLAGMGVMEGPPKADAVFALHGWPGYPLGVAAGKEGVLMAGADQFTVRVEGPGGHGAMPQLTADTITAAAEIITKLPSIVSRKVAAQDAAVVSVGSVHGGNARNAIPDVVVIEGTVRYLRESVKACIKNSMEEIIAGCAQVYGAEYEFQYIDGYIPLENDPEMIEFARTIVRKYIGRDNWLELRDPSMGSEDFAYFLRETPGALIWLGLGEESPGLHTPVFDFDDKALRYGITLLSGLALDFLK